MEVDKNKAFKLKGIYDNIYINYKVELEVIIVAKDSEEAKSVLLRNYLKLKEFHNEMIDFNEYSYEGCIKVTEIEEFNGEIMNEADIFYTIPTGIGPYSTNGVDSWENVIESFTADTEDFPKFRMMHVENLQGKSETVLYYESDKSYESSRKAMSKMSGRGINPWGV